MTPADSPVLRDIVLIGGGHSHVGVLRMFGMQPEPGVRLTLICTDSHTPYSGMLPGYVAGHYGYDDVHIDLRRLAQFAQARYIHAAVTGIDRAERKVLLAGRPPLAYDYASINIGSTPRVTQVPGAQSHAVPVKPIHQFNLRWLALLDRVRSQQKPLTIAVVGAGAGGVELTLAMQWRLQREREARGGQAQDLRFHLYSSSAEILPTHTPWVRQHFTRLLAQRGIELHAPCTVAEVMAGRLLTQAGQHFAADEVVWVTQAGGAAWLSKTGLELDESGFIKVRASLQSVSDARIFAAGDIVHWPDRPLEKAGVFAVRMGPPLARNLRAAARGETTVAWRPQRRWLSLISTGDRNAVASRGRTGFAGPWVWRWKDWIDRRFMRRFAQFPPMDAQASPPAATAVALDADESRQAISAIAMRCGGCGAKVGTDVLARALGSLSPIRRDDVLIGLDAPDDAAVVRVPPGKAMVHTVDFFRAFIDDPYVFGKVAANHALGDIFAMGAQPQSATAVVTVPPGLEAKVEDLLHQMMSGAVEVLNAAGCALVGGHTGEGRELALGFAINGLVDDTLGGLMRKGGMRPGDQLILTKPIGTGTLFAALPQAAGLPWFRGRWIDAALASMVTSNREAAEILFAHGVTACTDLTGFGLLGHLVEMTRPSGVDARLCLAALPLLDGASECVAHGITSSLQPANVRLRRALRNQADFVNHPRYPLIFDPQTAGGLLASVPADRSEACLAALRSAGLASSACIGSILEQGEALEPIELFD